jgi:hypothetical protein
MDEWLGDIEISQDARTEPKVRTAKHAPSLDKLVVSVLKNRAR